MLPPEAKPILPPEAKPLTLPPKARSPAYRSATAVLESESCQARLPFVKKAQMKPR